MHEQFSNNYVRLEIADDGTAASLTELATGRELLARAGVPIAVLELGEECVPASSARREGNVLRLGFGETGIEASLAITPCGSWMLWALQALTGRDDVTAITFLQLDLALNLAGSDVIRAAVLTRNLHTHVAALPKPTNELRAHAYQRFGFAGAEASVLITPVEAMRTAMQAAVSASPELPHSPLGGPWAWDKPETRGSYIFNIKDLTVESAPEWIALAHKLGINQIDFHGGLSFRFGDCMPNPLYYPEGRASLKAVINQLHSADIKAGLHTYAFFIDKTCPWVTPVPDPRLAAARTLTLAQGIDAEATEITVNESTEGMHATTGFFVRNSNVCMIGEELITFTEASQSAPWVIRGCERGALGTQAAPHAAGSTLRHLKECFGLLVPDPETDFLSEVAATQAQFYNECGFDMMYLDALDGEDILGGAENGWHYGSQFVYELFKHLKKPPIMEMSTFHHHLWMVRSRIGAWDHPNRSHKRFIDLHVRENAAHSQIYLPGHLGWWAVKTWGGSLNEPTFSDDIEYLCGKAIGTGVGISVMGIDPVTIREVPAYQRLGALMATYEGLRHANYFTEAQRAELAVPGAEFTLREANGVQRLVRRHSQRRVLDAKTSFTLDNPFATQVPSLRLEGLLECAPEDDPLAVTLFDLCDSSQVSMREAAEGVTLDYDAGEGRISVTNHSAPENGAWAMLHRDLGLLDLSKQLGLGLWVEGDGSGATLNIQLRSPQHLPAGIGEHYVKLNFSGWRYITLIEPEGEAWEAFQWPYGYPYMIHRENVHYDAVASVSVWLNGIPQDKRVSVAIREVRALPLLEGEVVNPGFGIGRESVTLPVTIKTGQYLECGPDGAGVLYGLRGETLAKVCAESPLPTLPQCNGTPASLWYEGTGRVRLTVFTEGEAI